MSDLEDDKVIQFQRKLVNKTFQLIKFNFCTFLKDLHPSNIHLFDGLANSYHNVDGWTLVASTKFQHITLYRWIAFGVAC